MSAVCLRLWIFLGLCFFPSIAYAQDKNTDDYLVELQQQAKQSKLSSQRTWHLLLKYKKKLFGGMISEADGMDFFNSPHGKTDPESELIATISSFFVPLAEVKKDQEHPQCNFPARFRWLSQQLNFDFKRLKIQQCDRLDRWINTLDPISVTLVFASHFMNNPASMFGHTLIRIDTRKAGNNNLMNYGANYAAVPDTENAFLYALKGLIGSFQGRFAIFPYYTKVQEYNNWESRDLWEYELEFTQDQLNMMLLHLWELGGTYFDYYYFQENCSYHVLSLLEIANPDLRLKDKFFFSVIPADTIKVVMEQQNLVKKIVYRPAVLNQMNHKRLKMNTQEKNILQGMIKGKITPESVSFGRFSNQSQALLLDTYMDYLQYHNIRQKTDREVKIPHSVLLARSRLQVSEDDRDSVTRFSSPPDSGHGADRFRLGVGQNDNEQFLEFAYRPAYHDLLAKDEGYDKNSEIIFMDFKLRYYLESERVRLDQAKILSITSLNPYDPLFIKPSWRVNLQIDTLRDLDCNYCNSFKANYGRGISYRPDFFSPLLLFSFIDLKTEVAGDLKQNYRLGGNIEIGAFYDINRDLRLKLAGSYQVFILGDSKHFFTHQFIGRYALSQDLDVRLEFNRYDQNHEGIFSINYFF